MASKRITKSVQHVRLQNTPIVEGAGVSNEPPIDTAELRADGAGAAAALVRAQSKLSDDGKSKLIVIEGKENSRVCNTVHGEVIRITRDRGRQQVNSRISEAVITRKKWPAGNIRSIITVDGQHMVLHEELPQLIVDPSDDPIVAREWMIRELMIKLELNEPFVFASPKKECNEWMEYADVGSDLKRLRTEVRRLRGVGRDLEARTLELIKSRLIVRSGGDFDTAEVFDGPIRSSFAISAANIYWEATLPIPELYRKYAPLSPAYCAPQLTELDKRARVFDDPAADLRGIPGHFRAEVTEIAVSLMGDAINGLSITSADPLSVESEIATATLAMHDQSTPLAGVTGMLSSSEIGPVIEAVILTCVFPRIQLSIGINPLDTTLSNFLAAIATMLMFPHSVLEERTHRAAKQVIALGLGRPTNEVLNADIAALNNMLQQVSLFQGAAAASTTVAASSSPFTNNNSYDCPLLTDDLGRHLLANALNGTVTHIRNRNNTPLISARFSNRGSDITTAFIQRIMTAAHTRAASLTSLCAGFAMGVSPEWRELRLDHPINLSIKAILSFSQLYQESGVISVFPFAVRIQSILLGVSNAILELAPYADSVRDVKTRGSLGLAESERLATKINGDIDSLETSDVAKAIIERAKAKGGKHAVMQLLINIANFNTADSCSRRIHTLVAAGLRHNMGAFGVTPYIILSEKKIESNVPAADVMFADHPFRLKSCVTQSINHAELSTIANDALATLIERGVVIECMMSYDFIIEGTGQNQTMERQPLCARLGGGYSLRNFSVAARMHSDNADTSGIMRMGRLMAPRLNVYVAPRNDYHPIRSMDLMMHPARFLSADVELRPHVVSLLSANSIPN